MHEFCGYAFIAELARALALRGHEVTFAYSASFQTPRGRVFRDSDDSDGLIFEPIHLDKPIDKFSFSRRFRQEREHARRLLSLVNARRPQIVISSNAPSQVQSRLSRYCRRREIVFINWIQDLYGLAAYQILRRRLPGIGTAIGLYFCWLDRLTAWESHHAVLISNDFQGQLRSWGMRDNRSTIIPNWAPLRELPVQPKDNPWSRRHGLHDKLCFLYSGTLAMKHNPRLLLELAAAFSNQREIRVVIVSEGKTVDWLMEEANRRKLDNIVQLPFQSSNELPWVLGSADVLVAVLEPEAGMFSVPSKVLSYLCAQRPLLLAVPPSNLAARTVLAARAGVVVDPTVIEDFINEGRHLASEPCRRDELGKNGRDYAERHFGIDDIANRFERIFKEQMTVATVFAGLAQCTATV